MHKVETKTLLERKWMITTLISLIMTPLMNFKLLQLHEVMLILSVSKNVLIPLKSSMC